MLWILLGMIISLLILTVVYKLYLNKKHKDLIERTNYLIYKRIEEHNLIVSAVRYVLVKTDKKYRTSEEFLNENLNVLQEELECHTVEELHKLTQEEIDKKNQDEIVYKEGL